MRAATAVVLGMVAVAVVGGGCAPAAPAEAVMQAAWDTMDARYGPFAQRGLDWDAIGSAWLPTVGPEADDEALWTGLTGMLAETDDGHVQLVAPGRPHWTANAIRREGEDDDLFDAERLRTTLLQEVEHDADMGYTLGRAGDVVVLQLDWISANALELERAAAWADALGGVGLIVDLRHNDGGDYTWMFEALSALTPTDVPVFRQRTRNAPERGSFDAWLTAEIPGSGSSGGGGGGGSVPVVVLTDRHTISAGERAVLGLRALPGVTLIGAPTNGALSTMAGYQLPNGWYMTFPTQEVETMAGEVFEGVGIPVDIAVQDDRATEEIDEVLSAALAHVQ